MPKKIVQISATQEPCNDPVCLALCDDGSVFFAVWTQARGWNWRQSPGAALATPFVWTQARGWNWSELPEVPGEEEAQEDG